MISLAHNVKFTGRWSHGGRSLDLFEENVSPNTPSPKRSGGMPGWPFYSNKFSKFGTKSSKEGDVDLDFSSSQSAISSAL